MNDRLRIDAPDGPEIRIASRVGRSGVTRCSTILAATANQRGKRVLFPGPREVEERISTYRKQIRLPAKVKSTLERRDLRKFDVKVPDLLKAFNR